ncbi:MAG TPA: tripartite tricarboxylate transporter substrate binding protein [Xanthobacteraceae bacterium]|nr:tripartite tricarboxylate transporter substrate binding protein [Xanthobacteraceae bacterium]
MNSFISRRRLLQAGAGVAAAALVGTPAFADFPDRRINWIVPFPAGGGLDTVTRIVAQKLSENIGQQVVVENKSGGAGFIGSVALATSKPDGYTLMTQALGMSMNPSIYKTLPYDPIKDIRPVAQIGAVPVVIAINPKVPANNLKELIAYAKANPKQLKGGSFALGSGTLLLEMFRLQAGIELPIVQYRGASDAIAATNGGETDIVIMDGTSVFPHIKAGRVRGIAIAADKRLPELPDVPTTVEAGLPDYKVEFWYTAFGQGGTPKPVVDKLNAEINKAVATKEVTDKLRAMGLAPANRTADDFTAQHHREMKEWAEIVAKSGFKPMEISQ